MGDEMAMSSVLFNQGRLENVVSLSLLCLFFFEEVSVPTERNERFARRLSPASQSIRVYFLSVIPPKSQRERERENRPARAPTSPYNHFS